MSNLNKLNKFTSEFYYNNSGYTNSVDSTKMNRSSAESYMEKMDICDIERYVRKKKLDRINNEKI